MAIKTVLIDDFDGTSLPSSSRTTTFALNGAQYEIDLAPDNVAKLRAALEPFISAGRRVGSEASGRSSRSSNRRTASRSDLGEIRAWAQGAGHKVGDRGRIPADVIEAYAKR